MSLTWSRNLGLHPSIEGWTPGRKLIHEAACPSLCLDREWRVISDKIEGDIMTSFLLAHDPVTIFVADQAD